MMLGLFVYLALLLGVLTTYKRLLLAEYKIPFFHYGCTVIEALFLAKAILLGRAIRLGERFENLPLIVPTLFKTFCFSGLVFGLSVLERFLEGWWHGLNWRAVLESCSGSHFWEILARMLMLFIAFVPLFAFWETNRILGKETLVDLFFKPKKPESIEPGYHHAKFPKS